MVDDGLILQWLEKRGGLGNTYPHFDSPHPIPSTGVTAEQLHFLRQLVDPKNGRRSFWPMLHTVIKTLQYKRSPGEPVIKTWKLRHIYYASHADSYFYSFYTFLLQQKYEEVLREKGLQGAVLAYRKVERDDPAADPSLVRGKSNVHFAYDAIRDVEAGLPCLVIAADVKGFFDNLSWKILEKNLLEVLGERVLPDPYKAIMRSLKHFCYVNNADLLRAFPSRKGRGRRGKVDRICSQVEFRQARESKETACYFKHSRSTRGVPQGLPISGLFSNIYMLDFDAMMLEWAQSRGIKYRRYSDDIFLIVPCPSVDHALPLYSEACNQLREMLLLVGLEEKAEKREAAFVFKEDSRLHIRKIKESEKGGLPRVAVRQSSFQYLGIEFTGSRILLRGKTISRFYQRVADGVGRITGRKYRRFLGYHGRPYSPRLLTKTARRRFATGGSLERKHRILKWGKFVHYAGRASSKAFDGELRMIATKQIHPVANWIETRVGSDLKKKRPRRKR